jgi:hypothetical protein
MSSEYPSDWDSRRKSVYKRDGYECQNCERVARDSNNIQLEAHHIVPKSKGGTHKITNLVTLCKECHNSIHNNTQAPTQNPRIEKKSNIDLFKQCNSTVMAALKKINGANTMISGGKINDDSTEQSRVAAIQSLAQLSVVYSAPTDFGQQKIDNVIRLGIECLQSFEDTWEKSQEEEGLSDKETKIVAEKTFKKRQQRFANALSEVNQLIQSGDADKFFNIEN